MVIAVMLQFSPQEVTIIELIKRHRELSLPALVTQLKANKSTVYYQVQALCKKGVVAEVKLSSKHVVYRIAQRSALQKIVHAHQKEVMDLLLASPKPKVGKKPKLVFSDWYILPPDMLKKLASHYQIVTYPNTPSHISPELFALRCRDADVVVTFFSVIITREILLACPTIKAIITASVSTECIDTGACADLGITVYHLDAQRGWKKSARVEFILSSLFALLRPLQPAADALRLGRFDYQGYHATELRGKTVGIVGIKREGREIVPILQGLGCAVYASNPDDATAQASDIGLSAFATPEELFKTCDIVIFAEDLAVPMKLDARLLNEAMRTQYLFCFSAWLKIDVQALRSLVISRKLKGVAIDYFADIFNIFGDFTNSEYRHIMNFPNVLITPEIGYYTDESMQRNYNEVFAILQNMEVAS